MVRLLRHSSCSLALPLTHAVRLTRAMPSRREFLITAGGSAAGFAVGCRSGASGASADALPNAKPPSGAPARRGVVGVGLFTLPKSLEQDFDGTLAMLAGLGYKEVELFGPYPVSTDAAKAGCVESSKTLGFSGTVFSAAPRDRCVRVSTVMGSRSPSMHVDFDREVALAT